MTVICVLESFDFYEVKASNLRGSPVYLESNHNVFSSSDFKTGQKIGTIDSKTVIDAIEITNEFVSLEYGSITGYVQADDILYGDALDNFVLAHKDYFDRKAVIRSEKAYLFATDDSGAFAVASKGEQFIVTEVDDLFVRVSFDNREAFIYKADVDISYFVQVSDFHQVVIKQNQSKREQISEYACQFVGNPYVWGGTSLVSGADCSGFIQTVFKDFGFNIPRCSVEQAKVGRDVPLADLQPGDLLFYNRGASIGHVAMYIGNGKIVHARNSKYGIVISDLDYNTPVCARNVID